MLINAFFQAAAKRRIGAAVAEIESVTGAEVVVAVAPASARYPQAPLLGGAVAGLAMLLLVLFHPVEVRLAAIPIDVVLAFAAAAALVAKLDPLRRIVCGRKQMRTETRRAARTTFVDRGLTRTRGRSAVFVYVSTFEKMADVVVDVGVEKAVAAGLLRAVAERIDRAIADGYDLEAFLGALRELAPILSSALPRSADDVNELPDAPDPTEDG